MEKVLQFLKDCQTFYLATMEGDKPHVRPFGAVCKFDGRLYLCSSNEKKVFEQLKRNPNIEISGMYNGDWIRLSGKVVFDNREEVQNAMLEDYPELKGIYSVDDGKFEVFYLENATANIFSNAGSNEIISF